MPKILTDTEIKQRLSEGRNYKRLYFELKVKYDEVVFENKQLRIMLAEQKASFEAVIETQNARIAELETMVFGRKPKGGTPIASALPPSDPKTPKTRTPETYRRPVPAESSITSEEHHPISDCHRCGHTLTEKDEAIRFEEDIVIASLSPGGSDVSHKTVVKHVVERGWCSHCGQFSSARDLRGQVVTIGPVVRSLIVYLVIQVDQTYAQARDLLLQLYQFKVTDGEITNILTARRETYLPAYEQLKQSVRAGPVHMDETSYPVQSERGAGYAHVMASALPAGTPGSGDVIFKLADSRGKGNSKDLIGENYQGVGITDRYGSYKNLFVTEDGTSMHQICWAHLHRTARDLTRLEFLSPEKLDHVTHFYQELADIYSIIRCYKEEAFDEVKRSEQADGLEQRLTTLCQPNALDLKKLSNLKNGILDYRSSLFLCLTVDGIPCDNNKAERSLRKLVIKRKKSFGVKTMNGARTTEVLLSICQSLYNKDRNNFLPALHALAG
jgi:Transposase IS66 family